jgi:hypothetical protein
VTTRAERLLCRIGAAGIAAIVVAVLLTGTWNFLLGSVTGSTATTRPAPCLPGREVPVLDSPHIPPAKLASVRYNSIPPTSGPHFAFTLAPGIYTEPVSEGLSVHAMEHGHVVIQYAPGTPRPTVQRLQRLAKRYGRDVILAPYPKLNSGIALTAWGRIDLLDRYDESRTTSFIERLRNRYVHGWTRTIDCPSPTKT